MADCTRRIFYYGCSVARLNGTPWQQQLRHTDANRVRADDVLGSKSHPVRHSALGDKLRV
jgi:hypothetical protein